MNKMWETIFVTYFIFNINSQPSFANKDVKTNKIYGTKTWTYTFHYWGIFVSFSLSCSHIFFILWTKDLYWMKFESSKPVGLIRPALISISSYGCIYQYYFVSLISFWLCSCCVYRYTYFISILLLRPVNIYFIPLALGITGKYHNSMLKIYLTNYIYIIQFQKTLYGHII